MLTNSSIIIIRAILITCSCCWGCTYFGTNILKEYSLGLFFLVPFTLGAMSTLLIASKQPLTKIKLISYALLTLLVYCIGLLLFAMEGIICLIMALPLGIVLTYIGCVVGFYLSNKKWASNTTAAIILALALPSIMSFEKKHTQNETVRSVTTAVDIAATPEIVWQNVVTFPQLKNPTEFIFKTGIAYPVNATIQGNGVGAIRKCNFTTGCFVEPITVWDRPNKLAFTVTDQPDAMKELSVYEIKPTHLNGYWVSQKGQFKLTKLKNGHTLLEGTTWYINKINPDFYWTLWSDYIIHKIHLRVLAHIKDQSEIH